MSDLIVGIIVTVFVALICAYVTYMSKGYIKFSEILNESMIQSISYVSRDESVVGLKGEVHKHPNIQTMNCPFDEDECVYEDWSVSKKSLLTKVSRRYSDENSVPFMLEDGRGRVKVNIDNIDNIHLRRNKEPSKTSLGLSVRDDIKEKINDDSFLSASTIRQKLIKLNDNVRVYGQVKRTDKNSERFEIVSPDDERESYITDYGIKTIRLFKYIGYAGILYSILLALSYIVFIIDDLFIESMAGDLSLTIFIILVIIGVIAIILNGIKNIILGLYHRIF